MTDTRPYIKLYGDYLNTMLALPPALIRVLIGISVYMDEDNVVEVSSRNREELLQTLKMSKQTFANSLVELQHAGLINRAGYGFYIVDPLCITKPQAHDV